MEHPILTTNRLLIRPFQMSDVREVFRLNATPEVMRFLPEDEIFADMRAAEDFLSSYIALSAQRKFVRQAVVDQANGHWLGWCGLREQENGEVDLGFRFHREQWGRGYAKESGQAWLRYGFTEASLDRIVAQTAAGNHASQHVLEKLCFQRLAAGDHDDAGFRWLKYQLLRRNYSA